jgi:hypothetical protein
MVYAGVRGSKIALVMLRAATGVLQIGTDALRRLSQQVVRVRGCA